MKFTVALAFMSAAVAGVTNASAAARNASAPAAATKGAAAARADPILDAERALFARLKALQTVDASQNLPEHGGRMRLSMSKWGFFWSHNWLALALLLSIANNQTFCLRPTASAEQWPYHPSAEFEARHGCADYGCYFGWFGGEFEPPRARRRRRAAGRPPFRRGRSSGALPRPPSPSRAPSKANSTCGRPAATRRSRRP